MLNRVIIAVAATVMLIASSCDDLRDNYDDCGVWLEFVFDHNMEFIDSFDQLVDGVDVLVFDGAGKLYSTLVATTAQLEGRKRMFLGGADMPRGQYTIVTVGGLTEHFTLGGGTGQKLEKGVTTIDQVRLAVDYDQHVAHRFPHVWLGESTKIDYRADLKVHRIPLMRLTNRFYITLQTTINQPDRTRDRTVVPPKFTFDITAPEQGTYNHLNEPVANNPLLYRPHTLSASVESGGRNGNSSGGDDDTEVHVTSGEINTMRLIDDHPGNYTLRVKSADGKDELWSHDLIELIDKADARDPAGNPLPTQEYLDRECEWNIVIVHGVTAPPAEGFVALRVIVNEWIVWDSGIDI